MVRVSDDGHVRVIALDRPKARNALDLETMECLVAEFEACQRDPDIRAVVLTGDGPAFCAGADLKELNDRRERGEEMPLPMRGAHRNIYEALLELYKPTIAVLGGPAVAGGCELALACDLRIAAPGAFLSLPEAERGMGANFASVVLPRLIPPPIALEVLYTGRRIEPHEAERLGLVNKVVEGGAEDAMRHGMDVARRIAENAPLTERRYKEMYIKSNGMPLPSALRLNVGPDPYLSEDRAEGVLAFIEKRRPRWKGR